MGVLPWTSASPGFRSALHLAWLLLFRVWQIFYILHLDLWEHLLSRCWGAKLVHFNPSLLEQVKKWGQLGLRCDSAPGVLGEITVSDVRNIVLDFWKAAINWIRGWSRWPPGVPWNPNYFGMYCSCCDKKADQANAAAVPEPGRGWVEARLKD